MSTPAWTEADFRAKFQAEQSALAQLEKINRNRLGSGSIENIKLLKAIFSRGLEKVLARKRSEERRQEAGGQRSCW